MMHLEVFFWQRADINTGTSMLCRGQRILGPRQDRGIVEVPMA